MLIDRGSLPIGRPGGCASKLSAQFIDKIIASNLNSTTGSRIIVGPEDKDDGAAYAIDDERSLVLSLDYTISFCRDPKTFGAISAANALSDIYAMGARPSAALSILGSPDTISDEVLLAIGKGAAEACADIGVPIVGGHSAETAELLFGLSVVGMCHPNHIVRNSTARPGDKIVLCKPLGFGVYAQAIATGEAKMTTPEMAWSLGMQINAVGADLAEAGLVSAMTDVTGFGLLGHLLEMVQGSGLRAGIVSSSIPCLPGCQQLIEGVVRTGASIRNSRSVAKATTFHRVPAWLRRLVTEPETNGGLLLAVGADQVDHVLRVVQSNGFTAAAVIGEFENASPGIDVT